MRDELLLLRLRATHVPYKLTQADLMVLRTPYSVLSYTRVAVAFRRSGPGLLSCS